MTSIVESPPEDIQCPPNDKPHFALITKIISDRPINISAFKSTMLKAWNPKGPVKTNNIETNVLSFVFALKEDQTEILQNGPWTFRGFHVVTKLWDPNSAFVDHNLDSSSFWIQVHNLPVSCMSLPTAQIIGNEIGRFVATDISHESHRWRKTLPNKAINHKIVLVDSNLKENPNPLDENMPLSSLKNPEIALALNAAKYSFWDSVTEISLSVDEPWIVISDFNSIFSPSEKRGGRPFSSSSHGSLQSVVDDIGLFDLGFTGYQFTWGNKRDGLANIQQRLDRGLVNAAWTITFHHSLIRHLLLIASDHSLLLLLTEPSFTTGPKPFRFEETWLHEDSVGEIIRNAWNTKFLGSPHFKIHSKIKKTRGELKRWNTNHFGHLQTRIDLTKIFIENVQAQVPCENLALMEAMEVDLDDSYKKLESMWRQKSRLKWLRDGDANTKFFHLSSILHRRNNNICEITAPNGVRTKAVVNCLDMFERWSGLSVNKKKSSIHFSHNVPPFTKLYIKDILDMNECDHKSKHFGLPFCKHARKSECFNDLIDCIGKTLSGWKAKHLSFAGRLVVLKSIAQALPIYHMSSFLMPKSICLKIDSLMRRFWWGHKEGSRGFNPVCWELVCSPKSVGGLGLRKMEHINQALVSKLAWNVAANPPKIWVQILSAKYLTNSNLFHVSSPAHNPSWTWKDICKSSSIIKKSA
ncbi:hypothetical protein BUALT_Bualt10G0039700 [Buddleja alternifolia]|uniref:DUF4283 domain-containing protein n=1 Tax=Buddleja alternifolia TaxID=168488 RepID=A0AAV6X2I3_9LAMI|nr:hypothetical protein BUALT_Bualt10G0039700 [Buddleja alternifolia]